VVLTLLAAEPIAVTRIRRVVSHPQPLGQARAWLRAHLAPEVELVEAASTAAAARDLEAYGPPESTAALGPAAAARRYGRQIVAWLTPGDGEAPNVTRFVVVARQDAPPTGRDRTSLVFAVTNAPGALVAALTVFAARGINLTRIESRPSKRALGEYMFHVDAEGHRLDPDLAAALAELSVQAAWIKLLGSYPAAPAPAA
jgi:prephenate dehydratase